MIPNWKAHDFIYEQLGPDTHILELGSGEGTANLVNLFRQVTTIEHDKKWLNKIENVNYIYAPLVPYASNLFREAKYWYDHGVLSEQLPNDYDVIFVDGPQGCYGRGGFFTYFDLFKHDVLIVFDDVFRLWEFRLMGRVAESLNVSATLFPISNKRWFGVVDGRIK